MSEAKRAQGQDGDPLELYLDEMNKDEREITLWIEKRGACDMSELAAKLGGEKRCPQDPTRPARNALRRLVRGRVLKNSDGVFEPGKRFLVALDPFARARAILGKKTPRETVDAGALVLAALDTGGKDTAVAKVVGQSRGYVIPRVKRLVAAKALKAKDLKKAGALLEAIAVAEAST